MSCMVKIKESLSTFTKTERKIGEFILENREEFIYGSAQAIASKIGTSAAAIVRFSKMMGFSGLPAMKVDLASSLDEEISVDLTEAIEEADSFETFLRKAHQNYMHNIEKTFELIHIKQLEEAIDKICHARRIYLFGIGASGVVCLDLYHKLTRIGYDVIYNMDTHTQLASTSHMNEQDVCIGISYSGENKEVLFPMEYAKNHHVTTIGVSKISKNKLTKQCDYMFYVPSQEKNLRAGAIASRNATFLITDLLYLGVSKMNYKKTKEDLTSTRLMIQKYKEY